jgi:3-oxoacyl-[acyl-carrier protein] reductase
MSVVRMSELVIPKMIEQKFGRIINITSASVKEPIPRLLLSNTFRPAIAGYSKSVSNNVAKYGITINNILPGTIHSLRHKMRVTDIAKNTGKSKDEVESDMENAIPAGRVGESKDIGKVVAFLASEDASYITGSCVRVDGGRMRSV